MKANTKRRLTRNSRRVNWFNGRKVKWSIAHSQGFERWAKLSVKPNLSPEFKAQIERNLQEKS